jgi:hypothetical protein
VRKIPSTSRHQAIFVKQVPQACGLARPSRQSVDLTSVSAFSREPSDLTSDADGEGYSDPGTRRDTAIKVGVAMLTWHDGRIDENWSTRLKTSEATLS